MKRPLIVIAGPTASGKTSLSIALAKRINGEIISADSMQVYQQMDIGTAKITEVEKEGIDHHLIDILNPDEQFNVHIFQQKALAAISDIHARGKVPILVGGTGFYIQSIIYGIAFDETKVCDAYRQELTDFAKDHGNEALHERLKDIDPASYEKIHPNNIKRVIRALEFYEQTGMPISEHNEAESQKTSPYNLLFYVLNVERSLLYQRINDRVDLMMKKGLLEEVKSLQNAGFTRDLISMQGIGYKELLDYLQGEVTYEEAVDSIKQNTRHFAKRQLTWFRREKDVIWINVEQFSNMNENILSKIIKDIEVNGIMY